MGKWEERQANERQILTDLIADGGIKEWIQVRWKSRTDRKQASFYNRLDELPEDVRRRYERLPDGRTIDVNALTDLSDSIGVAVSRAKKAGRRATLEDVRRLWAKSEYKDLSFEFYWRHLPASERREVEG